MAQQTNMTAVEWLEKELKDRYPLMNSEPFFEQAKQIEKQQIMIAIKDSWYMAKGSNFQEPQEEQYYNETYGKG